jgi:predicted glutamine amidotransferase
VNDRANTLYYRETSRGIVIVSEPFDHDNDWRAVPEDHVIVAKAGERTRVVPLFHSAQQAAE